MSAAYPSYALRAAIELAEREFDVNRDVLRLADTYERLAADIKVSPLTVARQTGRRDGARFIHRVVRDSIRRHEQAQP